MRAVAVALSWQDHCVSAASRSNRPRRCDTDPSTGIECESAAINESMIGRGKEAAPASMGFGGGDIDMASLSNVADTLTTEIRSGNAGGDFCAGVKLGVDLGVETADLVADGPAVPV
jgi:hypothetical protein